MEKLQLFDLGLTSYVQAWLFQRQIFSAVKQKELAHALIICQHLPVITLGRSSGEDELKVSYEELKRRNIDLYRVERGGRATYHGPGQITIYPICNLKKLKKDLSWYLRTLEEAVMLWLGSQGVFPERKLGHTGVWVQNRKICSIGIAVKNWISFHGLSVIIKAEELEGFSLIKPCGQDIQMISLEELVTVRIPLAKIKEALIGFLKEILFEQDNAELFLSL